MIYNKQVLNRAISTVLSLAATVGVLAIATSARPARAQYTEVEDNGSKAAANVINLGAATSATINGASASSADSDYFRINTSYSTPGIYVNQLQLNNSSSVVGSLRGLAQSSGTVTANESLFQSSLATGTVTPYGLNQYYSFGGTGKTQSMYYKVAGYNPTTGASYTSTFTSTRITPTALGTLPQGYINMSALANIGSSGTATNTEVIVLDSNYNVYYDNVAGSPTFGYAAMNDNSSNGFNLTRFFSPGTYYVAIGISNLATNDASPVDDTAASRNSSVLDFDNVLATSNTQYGSARPTGFQLTDGYGNTITRSDANIASLYGVNFYSINVAVVPESHSILLFLIGGAAIAGPVLRRSLKIHSA